MRTPLRLIVALVVASVSPAAARIAATVLVDGTPLDTATLGQVQLVTVGRTANVPDACTIELAGQRQGTPEGPFAVGQQLEIVAGTGAAATSIFKGEIVGIEPSFASRGPATMRVTGFDRLHTLTRGRRTKTWQNQSDGDIVKRLAEDAGIAAVVQEPGFGPAFVYQHNQTDLEFLRARAARIGFEVHVEDGVVHFGAAPSLDGAAERNVTLFNPRLFGAGQAPASVEVRGWDPIKKEPIIGHASRGPAGVAFLEDHADASTEEFRSWPTTSSSRRPRPTRWRRRRSARAGSRRGRWRAIPPATRPSVSACSFSSTVRARGSTGSTW